MSDILAGTSDWDAVRSLIYASATVISDAVLESFPFIDTVEELLKKGITDWATIKANGGADWTFLRSGTAYLLAARVVSDRFSASVTLGSGFKVGGYSESGKSGQNWQEIAAALIDKARAALSAISTRTFTRQSIVLRDGPTTSGTNVPPDFEYWLDKILPRVLDWVEEGGEDDTVYP